MDKIYNKGSEKMKRKILSLALAALMLGATMPTALAVNYRLVEREIVYEDDDYYEGDYYEEEDPYAAFRANYNVVGPVDGETGFIFVVKDGKHGVINAEGKEIVPPAYTSIGNYCNGVAIVMNFTDGKFTYGAVNTAGQLVIPMEYEGMGDWTEEGTIFACKDGAWGLIDRNNKSLTGFVYSDQLAFSEGLASVGKEYKWGYINTKGEEVIPCQYGAANSFQNGLAAVRERSNDLWGFIDTTGKVVTDFVYESVGKFRDGMAVVQKDKLYGYVNSEGKEVVPCQYWRAEKFQNGFGIVQSSYTKDDPHQYYGCYNTEGKLVVPVKYESIGGLESYESGYVEAGVLYAKKDGKYGFVTLEGTELTDFVYSSHGNTPNEGMITYLKKEYDGKCGAVSLVTGEEIVPFEYDYMGSFHEGFLAVQKDGKWAVLNDEGERMTDFVYDYVGMFVQDGDEVYATVERDGKYLQLVKVEDRTAYASTQNVLVDGKSVEFQCYALKDANGNDTNYIKLRDVASVLNGTAAQFNVGWDGNVNIETGKAYAANGSEMSTPYSGNRSYENATAATNINGAAADLSAILLKDDAGNGYTYYKLRDLGNALGFKVDWSKDKGIFIETK